jgi:predicted nucleic acid-binding protein
VIVVDASALAPALADDGRDGDLARARLAGEVLLAPELAVLEVASILRRAHRSGHVDVRRCEQALADLRALPLACVPHRPLLARAWQLRDNATAYDAAYLALAELVDSPLLTADSHLAGVPGIHCEVELLAAGD